MVQEEHRISYDGGEATLDSSKKVKPDKSLHRGLGIAVLEKLAREESQKSDGTLSLLWSWFQSDASSSSNSHFYLNSELAQLPWEPQVMNYSSLHSIPGAGLHIELELPSNQNLYGIVNVESWADEQIRIHQIVGMNHPWPFQMNVAQNQRVTVPEPIPISCLNCGTMAINGTQGKTTDWSIDGSLNLHNGINLDRNHFTVKRNGGSEEDECLPSVCSSTWSQKTMPIRQFFEINTNKRQKKIEKSAGSKASSTPPEALVFYNFMELPHNDYIAERDMVANRKRSRECSDVVDLDLKL